MRRSMVTFSVAVGLSQIEIWKFKTPELNLDQSTPNFRFAIFYNNLNTGEWFWDNNFGQDYTPARRILPPLNDRTVLNDPEIYG